MALDKTAQKAANRIDEALADYDLSQDEKDAILKIIEKSLVRTVEETSDTHKEATVICCGPEADLAHKIQEEVDRKMNLLISNLMALR
ncbi:MAG: hypothetical protein AAF353_18015 [Pseudomonadota bacterium]